MTNAGRCRKNPAIVRPGLGGFSYFVAPRSTTKPALQKGQFPAFSQPDAGSDTTLHQGWRNHQGFLRISLPLIPNRMNLAQTFLVTNIARLGASEKMLVAEVLGEPLEADLSGSASRKSSTSTSTPTFGGSVPLALTLVGNMQTTVVLRRL